MRVVGGVREDPRTQPRPRRVGLPRRRRRRRARHPAGPARRGRRQPTAQLVDQARRGDDRRVGRSSCARRSSGDWSTYTLRLVGAGGAGAPAGIDLPLSTAPFTFTVDCPSDLDCAPATERPPGGRRPPARRLPRARLRGAAHPAARPARDPAARLDRPQRRRPRRHARRALRRARRPARLLAGRRGRRGLPRHRPAPHLGAPTCAAARLRRARGLLGAHAARLHDRLATLDAAARHARHRRCPSSRASTSRSPARCGRASEARSSRRARRPRRHARRATPCPCTPGATRRTACRPGPTAAFVSDPGAAPTRPLAGDLLVLVDRPIGGTPRGRPVAPLRRAPRRGRPSPHRPAGAGAARSGSCAGRAADALPAPLTVTTPGTPTRRAPSRSPTSSLADHGAERRRRAARAADGARPTDAYRPRLQRPGPQPGRPIAARDGVGRRRARGPTRALGRPVARTLRRAAHVDAAAGPARQRPARDPPRRRAGAGRASRRLRFGDGVSGRAPVSGTTALATYRVGGGAARQRRARPADPAAGPRRRPRPRRRGRRRHRVEPAAGARAAPTPSGSSRCASSRRRASARSCAP